MADVPIDAKPFSPFLDMLHAALSPDGRFIALGTQDDGHHILEIDATGAVSIFARPGPHSEYPHDACFSDDSRFVALNACHFYSGVTFVSELAKVQGPTGSARNRRVAQRASIEHKYRTAPKDCHKTVITAH